MAEEIVNPFPSPPSQYKLYTKTNLALLSLLRARTDTSVHDELSLEKQREVLADQSQVPAWDLTTLEPPRADWIVEEGGYETFGDLWLIPERHPTLEEGGVTQLYPKGTDHRPALQKLLQTLLLEYHSLVGALLIPPPPMLPDVPQEPLWAKHIDWIGLVALNMVAAVNELRPIQARGTLELALKNQLAARREETRAIHALWDDRKCDALTATLATLRLRAAEIGSPSGGSGDRDQAQRRIIDKALSADEAVMSAEPMAIDGDLPAAGILGARAGDEWDLVDLDQVWRWAEETHAFGTAG
ncbi:hypothetical protein BS47DRAFT_1386358 [Hydnum rufescens UP504]|uniref:Mediator of RNA polymerase II transcription subunit 7 n=1 Tax=Hydnum rufescens UP504 TaxID=1448309 RepID=A0A9P6ADI9_9AGAM|nr:hypothetical protein BS47DRAFT_1386358 [Hydnum rufescens UP504]